MITQLAALTQLCGISGNEDAVRAYLTEQIAACPDIIEQRTDRLGNLLVHKKGRTAAAHTVLLGAHMDEVGMIVTGIDPDGRMTIAPVGGVEADAVLGRAVQTAAGVGVISSEPVHKLTAAQKNKRPAWEELRLDIGAEDAETPQLAPGDPVYFCGAWTPLGGGRVTAKAIDDRFGCAVLLSLLKEDIPCDTWFCFFVQEEIGLRGSRAAAFSVAPEYALILEATTAADLDGVSGADAVCRLGGGPVVSFMDRSTIYDRELYALAFAEAEALGIPCQTKTRIAGGNDAGAVHISRDGVRTIAVSVPCRYLHTPSCVAQESDMTQCLALTRAMLGKMHRL